MVCQYSQRALWCWSMEKYKELGIIFLVLLALRGVRELVSRFGMIYSVEIKLWRRLQESFFFFFLNKWCFIKTKWCTKSQKPKRIHRQCTKKPSRIKNMMHGRLQDSITFEFTWCLINVIFVAELLVYLLYTSYVLELHPICTFKWIFTYRREGKEKKKLLQ